MVRACRSVGGSLLELPSEHLFRNVVLQVHNALSASPAGAYGPTVIDDAFFIGVDERVFCPQCNQSTDLGQKESPVSTY
jgi:hypothetical protein